MIHPVLAIKLNRDMSQSTKFSAEQHAKVSELMAFVDTDKPKIFVVDQVFYKGLPSI
jgi:hypothetical protein